MQSLNIELVKNKNKNIFKSNLPNANAIKIYVSFKYSMNYLSSRFNFERSENKLSKIQNETKKRKNYLDLTSSNPTLFFNYDTNKINLALTKKTIFPYEPDPQGLLNARLAIVEYYARKGRRMNPNLLFLTSGTSEAMSFILKATCDTNSEILLPTPGYPLFDFIFKLENVKSKNYSLIPNRIKNQNKLIWGIDFNELETNINKNTKAIVIVEPNNPTGSRIIEKDAKRLQELILKHNLFLIMDEVFSDYYDEYYSTNFFERANCILLNGLSKMIGLPQLKLSWIYLSGESNFLEQIKESLLIISDSYLSVNIPVQLGVSDFLDTAENIQTDIQNRIQSNIKIAENLLQNETSIEYFIPDGGWYLLLKINSELDDEEFACNLLKTESVYVHPGYMFDIQDDCYIVISLILLPEVFKEGIQRLARFVSSHK